jgi:hypothetical protein
MNWSFLVRWCIPHGLELSRREFYALETRVMFKEGQPVRERRTLVLISTTAAALVLTLLAILVLAAAPTGGNAVPLIVAMVAVSLIPLLVTIPLTRRLYLRQVRRALREMGYDVCVECGYWLRGLERRDDDVAPDDPRCPECGAERPALGTAEPKLPGDG